MGWVGGRGVGYNTSQCGSLILKYFLRRPVFKMFKAVVKLSNTVI